MEMIRVHQKIRNINFSMPNGNIHTLTGTLAGFITSLKIQEKINPDSPVDFKHLILGCTTGAATGRLPDILEPALNPNHRAFFHSFIVGVVISYIGVQIWKKLGQQNSDLTSPQNGKPSTEFLMLLGLIAIASYVLHLLLDSFTKKGLPLA